MRDIPLREWDLEETEEGYDRQVGDPEKIPMSHLVIQEEFQVEKGDHHQDR